MTILAKSDRFVVILFDTVERIAKIHGLHETESAVDVVADLRDQCARLDNVSEQLTVHLVNRFVTFLAKIHGRNGVGVGSTYTRVKT